jgi:hypothetical protein
LCGRQGHDLNPGVSATETALTALNACNTFVLRALTDAMLRGEGMVGRSATGAAFCVQWLDNRAVDLERRLKNIHERATENDLGSK